MQIKIHPSAFLSSVTSSLNRSGSVSLEAMYVHDTLSLFCQKKYGSATALAFKGVYGKVCSGLSLLEANEWFVPCGETLCFCSSGVISLWQTWIMIGWLSQRIFLSMGKLVGSSATVLFTCKCSWGGCGSAVKVTHQASTTVFSSVPVRAYLSKCDIEPQCKWFVHLFVGL